MQDQLFAQEAADPGLAGFGVAGQQNVASASKAELTSVFQMSEQETPPSVRRVPAVSPSP